MRGEISYKSKIFGECASDYDFSKIGNINELKFLKWMNILQAITTRLKYNIEMFEYFIRLYFLNDVIKNKFQVFFTMVLSNVSAMIAIDFGCLIFEDNELNIDKFKNFCSQNSIIFKNDVINNVLKTAKPATKKAKDLYKQYFHIPRNKLFAHIDDILLEDNNVDNIINNVNVRTMKKLLHYIMKVLNIIWFAYNKQKLCFALVKGNDYKKLIKSLCILYGDTKFT